MTDDLRQVSQAMGEAEGSFRAIRKLATTEENNFVLDRSDSIAEKAMNSLGFLTVSATVIGLITLIGAAIGLMNIMLVSVSERTKEVGLIKAIGGKSKMVRRQFLLEAVIISVLGAIIRDCVRNSCWQSILGCIEYGLCGSMELGDVWNYYL